jgi:shikimate kinase
LRKKTGGPRASIVGKSVVFAQLADEEAVHFIDVRHEFQHVHTLEVPVLFQKMRDHALVFLP